MVSQDDLKDWLHRDLSNKDKILLTLASFDAPVAVYQLRDRALEAGLRIPDKWNVSQILSRTNGLAIKLPAGWELSKAGKNHLRDLGVKSASPAAIKVASDLRNHLANINNKTTKDFVEEAIKCYEAKLHRSAVVMSWIAAIDILHREVVSNHLSEFNSEAKRVNQKWKDAANEDGLSRMKESEFLERIVAIGIIGKNVKDELQKALTLRNGCGHPNSLKLGGNMVASHLETLILNVFEKFSA